MGWAEMKLSQRRSPEPQHWKTQVTLEQDQFRPKLGSFHLGILQGHGDSRAMWDLWEATPLQDMYMRLGRVTCQTEPVWRRQKLTMVICEAQKNQCGKTGKASQQIWLDDFWDVCHGHLVGIGDSAQRVFRVWPGSKYHQVSRVSTSTSS